MTSPVIIICGATATGKSDLALEIAHKFNGEIVNADSMQLYKGMDIGTAKPTVPEMVGITHYLLDVVEPDQPFSVADFTFEMRNSNNYMIHNFNQTVKVTTAEASKFTNGSI